MRPDPDELLARVREEEQRSARGKLTIFFGFAPGVGKTYTMLEAARGEAEDQKRDVVVGIAETHGRYDTGSLLIGLELLPRRPVEHRGIQLDELDLDAALKRRPQLLLVDELAHTNAPGSRHLKRWQDVDELLAAGIDVFTTLNVQHLESLNDVVAQITGVLVRETVPDAVFDKSSDVRVVDLPVDELLERLREGKVYVPQQAARAVDNFFRAGNLIALRELALRRTAERVDAQMRGYKAAHGIEESWHTGERVLVCVSPSPHSTRLVRAARRMATSLHAELVGVYVETQASVRLPAEDREQLARNMRLVESLGGEAVVLRAEDVAVETVRYARKRNATKIVVGKPTRPRWRELFRASFLDQIVRQSLEIDVYVISGQASDLAPPAAPPRQEPRKALQLAGGLAAIVVTTLCTLIGWYGFGQDQLADVVMVYLLGVIVVSMRYGYVPSLLAAVLGVVAFDFFFIPPYYSFSVSDLRHIVTFGVMFLVAVVVSHLTKRIRDQADSARRSERRAASLYSLSREVGLAPSRDLLLAAAERHLREVFGVRVAVLLPGPDGMLDAAFAEPGTLDDGQKDKGVAEWAWLHQRPAGAGTDTLPSARALFVPLKSARGRVGVLALYPSAETRLGDPEDRQLLDTFAGLIGSALERTQLADEARRAHLRAETEQLRNSLLSSVSHDLRTPLAVVTGATSSLLDEHGPRDEHVRRELLQTVHEEALRLNRLVRNLLDMTRLEAGALKVHEEMQPIEEVVGSALDRMDDRLRGRAVDTRIPADLPLVPFDSALIEQVLINLLENATKYTPAGTPIEVAARTLERFVEVEVNDRGPGVGPRDTERVFDKFYRAREGEGGGVGLGLTICRGIVSAHGGRIWVEERAGGGASFRFRLPLEPKASGPALAAPQEQESQAR
ncbi:MAG TPA: sensor histidine kinase KdpD [Polyangiaceae bacterium]|jgi:two-component system sensor histidine kinase KdpD